MVPANPPPPPPEGCIRTAVHRRRRGGTPPPPDQSDHRGNDGHFETNFPIGKILSAIFGPPPLLILPCPQPLSA